MVMEIKSQRFSEDDKRAIALERAAELKRKIGDYLEIRHTIKTGFEMDEIIKSNKKKILAYFKGTEEN